jgi:hypothetical protein
MTVSTAAGVTFGIGTSASIDESSAAAAITDFQNDSYTAAGEVENIGEFGDSVNPVNFTALADNRVRKFKGSRDAGTMTLTLGFDSADSGQDALQAAADDDTQTDYNFRVVLNDGTSGGSGTELYFYGKVMGSPVEVSSVDNIVRRSVQIGINSPIYQVDAT